MRVLDMYHGDVMVFLVCLNRMLISYYISVPGYFHVMTTLYHGFFFFFVLTGLAVPLSGANVQSSGFLHTERV